MPRTHSLPLLFGLLATIPCAMAQDQGAEVNATLSAPEIMARVAANQDRSEAERAHFVYVQHAQVQSRKGRLLMCEEITDMRVTPTEKGSTRALLALNGHVRSGNRTIHYTTMPKPWSSSPDVSAKPGDADDADIHGDAEAVQDADAGNQVVKVDDTDLSVVESMRRQFTSDKEGRDGLSNGLFPLTTDQQKGMDFTLTGTEVKNGRQTYHIAFRPRVQDDYGWKGDAWVDTASFQPVVVRTALSRSLPLGVRMLLGTNLPGLGFTAIYAPQGDGVWFPASFGTEFKVKALFVFHRQVIVSVVNRDFERTHVSSRLHAAEPQAEEQAIPQH